MKTLPPGKINVELLEKLIKKFCHQNQRVVVGPKVGEDATVIDVGDRYIVCTTDPITFTTDECGWYAVNVNANDIASMGAIPKWFLATLLLPTGRVGEEDVERIFSQISGSCNSLGIALCGGHTEVTSIDRVIIIGQMLGEVQKGKLITSSGAKVGDSIFLVKGVAIEGTSIIAREKYESLREKIDEKILERSKNFLYSPGISVVKEAILVNEFLKIHSMHDPTEGGLRMGLYELAKASGVGVKVFRERIKIYPETQILSKEYGIEPLGLIASGALLFTTPPREAAKAVEFLEERGVEYSLIGEILPPEEGLKIVINGVEEKLLYSEKDEILKIYDS
jgi:hydrogenase maturation factor